LPGAAEQGTERRSMRGGIMMGMGMQVSNGLKVQPTIDPHKAAEEKEATKMKKLVFHDDGSGLIPVMVS
jgi:hypothetical protein